LFELNPKQSIGCRTQVLNSVQALSWELHRGGWLPGWQITPARLHHLTVPRGVADVDSRLCRLDVHDARPTMLVDWLGLARRNFHLQNTNLIVLQDYAMITGRSCHRVVICRFGRLCGRNQSQ